MPETPTQNSPAAERTRRLAEQPIPGLLLRLCLPAMVGMTTAALYNLVDAVFVGLAVNEDALAGVSVAMPYMFVLLAVSMLVAFGGASIVSIRLGEKDHDQAERTLGSATFMMLVMSVVVTVAGVCFIDSIIGHLSITDKALAYAHDYLQIIIYGSAFQIMGYGLNAMIRAEGNPRTAMYTLLIGVLLNVVLAYVFLFLFHWGTRGAALATVISQSVSAFWVILYFTTGQSHVKLRWAYLWPNFAICRRIAFIGFPMCLRQTVSAGMFTVLNYQLAFYGEQATSKAAGGAMAVAVFFSIYRFMFLFLMPVFGVNQGTQPIVSYNFGAQRFDRVKKALMGGITMAISITLLGFLIAMILPGAVLSLFVKPGSADRSQFIALGVHAMRICLMMFPLLGFQVVASSYFQAVGKPIQAMVLMLSPTLLFNIPLVFVLPHYIGLDGIWWAQPCSDFCASLITCTWLLFEIRHLGKRHDDSVLAQNRISGEKGSPVLERA